MPLVYKELRQLTHNYVQRDRPDRSSPRTTLVHDAYLRMVDGQSVTWKDRAHFYGIAARLLRRILVDDARDQQVAKRDGHGQEIAPDDGHDPGKKNGAALAALDRALETFGEIYPRESEVVELKFFGGLNTKEISKILGVTETTVQRDWNFAKLWLYRELNANAP